MVIKAMISALMLAGAQTVLIVEKLFASRVFKAAICPACTAVLKLYD